MRNMLWKKEWDNEEIRVQGEWIKQESMQVTKKWWSEVLEGKANSYGNNESLVDEINLNKVGTFDISCTVHVNSM